MFLLFFSNLLQYLCLGVCLLLLLRCFRLALRWGLLGGRTSKIEIWEARVDIIIGVIVRVNLLTLVITAWIKYIKRCLSCFIYWLMWRAIWWEIRWYLIIISKYIVRLCWLWVPCSAISTFDIIIIVGMIKQISVFLLFRVLLVKWWITWYICFFLFLFLFFFKCLLLGLVCWCFWSKYFFHISK